MITTLEDCEAAFNELALDGYTWQGEYEDLSYIPGCQWASAASEVIFNPDLTAINTTGELRGGICRVGGTQDPTEFNFHLRTHHIYVAGGEFYLGTEDSPYKG
jgi:hypothetical protein